MTTTTPDNRTWPRLNADPFVTTSPNQATADLSPAARIIRAVAELEAAHGYAFDPRIGERAGLTPAELRHYLNPAGVSDDLAGCIEQVPMGDDSSWRYVARYRIVASGPVHLDVGDTRRIAWADAQGLRLPTLERTLPVKFNRPAPVQVSVRSNPYATSATVTIGGENVGSIDQVAGPDWSGARFRVLIYAHAYPNTFPITRDGLADAMAYAIGLLS